MYIILTLKTDSLLWFAALSIVFVVTPTLVVAEVQIHTLDKMGLEHASIKSIIVFFCLKGTRDYVLIMALSCPFISVAIGQSLLFEG